ncbi:hypothetical protein GALMADRAFT_260177 [Galerina marginata CBS 339.88]|uniref:Uncharacterized protein n=1 Tax=Galerina marginata (strain CBS 339.88) TaxID=685588 RepID=A0A067S4F1_GALM3|nr:hypothetical protein GALMADRAFT_260177 [Galerina marginata CBS 339.88]
MLGGMVHDFEILLSSYPRQPVIAAPPRLHPLSELCPTQLWGGSYDRWPWDMHITLLILWRAAGGFSSRRGLVLLATCCATVLVTPESKAGMGIACWRSFRGRVFVKFVGWVFGGMARLDFWRNQATRYVLPRLSLLWS